MRRLISSSLRRRIKALLGRNTVEEVSIVLDTIGDLPGTMVDVGAHHGTSLEGFARRGWRVFAFEPDAKNRSILTKAVRGFPSVTIDDRALSDRAEDRLPFYTSLESSGLSGLLPFDPSHQRQGCVRTTTLRDFCAEIDLREIDFLKIDTEGLDLLVLQGVAWESVRPRLILCEFEDRKTASLAYTFHDMAEFLHRRDYQLLVSEWYPIVRYGARHKWRRFAEYPCRLASNKAWGNIIAVDDPVVYKALTAVAARHQSRVA